MPTLKDHHTALGKAIDAGDHSKAMHHTGHILKNLHQLKKGANPMFGNPLAKPKTTIKAEVTPKTGKPSGPNVHVAGGPKSIKATEKLPHPHIGLRNRLAGIKLKAPRI